LYRQISFETHQGSYWFSYLVFNLQPRFKGRSILPHLRMAVNNFFLFILAVVSNANILSKILYNCQSKSHLYLRRSILPHQPLSVNSCFSYLFRSLLLTRKTFEQNYQESRSNKSTVFHIGTVDYHIPTL